MSAITRAIKGLTAQRHVLPVVEYDHRIGGIATLADSTRATHQFLRIAATATETPSSALLFDGFDADTSDYTIHVPEMYSSFRNRCLAFRVCGPDDTMHYINQCIMDDGDVVVGATALQVQFDGLGGVLEPFNGLHTYHYFWWEYGQLIWRKDVLMGGTDWFYMLISRQTPRHYHAQITKEGAGVICGKVWAHDTVQDYDLEGGTYTEQSCGDTDCSGMCAASAGATCLVRWAGTDWP